jgi:ParB family transcriptional regulator, chromosome partitioning protein
MTTSTAANVVGQAEKDKEKVEKRRALGRGLESLLPGPRVVSSQPAPARQSVPPSAPQQVPHRVSDSVRNDIPSIDIPSQNDGTGTGGRSDKVEGDKYDGVIRAEADPAYLTEEAATSPLKPKPGLNGAPVAPAAELRSVGQPGDIGEGSEEGIEILAMAESRAPSNLVVNLRLEQIDKNPFQTRYVDDNDNLEELAESIKTNGVVQPIVVRPAEEDGRFTLILGERRLHASKKAGKTTIPAIVRKVSDQQAAEMTIIENLQREDLSALEQAEAFRVLSRDFHLTQQQIGERIGLSRQSVANYMRLLKLPRDVMQLLAEKKLTFHEAREMLALSSDDQISQAALYAVKHGLSIEQIERLVLSMNGDLPAFPGMPGAVKKRTGGARWVDPNVRSAQVDLERLLGVRVRIRDRKGKGKIVIEYATVDDYERVVEMLRGKK